MWKEQINKLNMLREQHLAGGGEDRTRRQHDAGKLSARERLGILLDEGSFTELYSCMATDVSASAIGKHKCFPGDGVITGWGLVDGRKVCVAAEDFTVIGGTLGKTHAEKIMRLQDLAWQMKVPVIFLNDSGGARIEEGINALSGYGGIFRRHVRASGVIPQICAVLGPCSGGACYAPALCDFIFAVKGISNMFITGPGVVETVLGKRPSMEELGGAQMHSEKSGCVHALYEDEASCLMGIRKLLSYLPSSCIDNAEKNADRAAASGPDLKSSATQESWTDIVPDQSRRAYDMHKVIDRLIDPGSPLFEIHKHFACNVITGFAYMGGRVTGIVANQPMHMGGSLDCDASDKLARFVRFCDCFGIPLLTLVDVPAFLPGTDQEQRGIIRHGAKILYAYAEAAVPKITLIVRKAYGGAYIAMNSRTLGADLVYAWPVAQIAVMGAEGAVDILYRREIASASDPTGLRQQLKEEYEQRFLNPDIAMEKGYVDEVILPEETRHTLIDAFSFLEDKLRCSFEVSNTQLPGYRHGSIPL